MNVYAMYLTSRRDMSLILGWQPLMTFTLMQHNSEFCNKYRWRKKVNGIVSDLSDKIVHTP